MPRDSSRNTKEAILLAALRLFSERGFDGVGVREIAGAVGLRESALYRHYSTKQEIFDSILDRVGRRYEATESAPVGDARAELFRLCRDMFTFYLTDEEASQLRRMLTIEQYRSTEAGRVFRELVLEAGLEHIGEALARLVDSGYYRTADPETMALQLYAPLYLLLIRFDGQPGRREEAVAALENHLDGFDRAYRADQER